MSRPPSVLGVDGCPGGWIGAVVAADGATRWVHDRAIETLLAEPVVVVGVDMPIGLPDGSGGRRCDRLARQALGARGVTVFSAPVRPVLGASSYEHACAVSRAAAGVALSIQTWHITPRIAELDRALDLVDGARRVVEVHPELAFAALTGAPLPSKHGEPGRAARLAAVGGAERLRGRPKGVPIGDCLDALAAAWSAARVRDGHARWLPGSAPPRDSSGRPMQIAV